VQIALPKPARVEEHTHAFDEYSNPFPSDSFVSGHAVQEQITKKVEGLELIALAAFGGVLIIGLIERVLSRRYPIEAWLTRQPERGRAIGRYDMAIPGRLLAVVAFLGLVTFSVLGAYTYYIAPEQALSDLHRIRADVGASLASSISPDPIRAARYRTQAIREIEQMDLAVRKLQVGVYIHQYRLTPEQVLTAEQLREVLEEMRDDLLASKSQEAHERRIKFGRAYQACREAYGGL
jgi:uncharacterized protein